MAGAALWDPLSDLRLSTERFACAVVLDVVCSTRTGAGTPGYTSQVPTLSVANYGEASRQETVYM